MTLTFIILMGSLVLLSIGLWLFYNYYEKTDTVYMTTPLWISAILCIAGSIGTIASTLILIIAISYYIITY